MDSEEVVIAEVHEEEPLEDEYLEGGGGRRISAGPIIAIVVVVIILSGLGYYIFSPAGVNSITMLNPEDISQGDDQRYGIGLEIHITGGMKSVDGTGRLDITYDGGLVHSREVKITGDRGTVEINYNEFVTENGVYDIRFSMEGKSTTRQYIAKMVPDNLNITYQYQTDPETREATIYAIVTPEFTYEDEPDKIVVGDSLFYYSWNYELETTLTPPNGEQVITKKSMWDYHRNKTYTKVWLPVEGEEMGNYSFTAKLTNNLVKDDSPYKVLNSVPDELVKYLNRAPELGDISKPSRIRVNTEVTFTLRASDPDTNGAITEYAIIWDYDLIKDGDNDTESTQLEKIIVAPGESSTVRVSHTFTQVGTFQILVTCGDNGYIGYLDDEKEKIDAQNYHQKFDSQELTVIITLI